MKKINISTPTYPNTYTLVDNEDYNKLNKFKWHASPRGRGSKELLYVFRDVWGNGKNRKKLRMHREIMSPNREYSVDHINGNALDNRKENLRICSHMENMCNTGSHSNSKSGIKGVSPFRKTQWRVSIKKNYKIYQKVLNNKNEAIKLYNCMARILHGEFAYQNKI